MIAFLKSQLHQIRQGGIRVLIRKSLQLALLLPLHLAVLPIRLIRPLLTIRFGPMPSSRIGHFAGNLEVYLCEREAEINVPPGKSVDIFYYDSPVSNAQLRVMWDRVLHVSPLNLSLFDRLNRRLPGGKAHAILLPHHDRDIHGLLAATGSHLSFTAEEEERGRRGLRALGVEEGAPFICFHARDAAYLTACFPALNAAYHDYRDSDIANFIPAAEELTRRGYAAIRMGAVVERRLDVENPKIIDYACRAGRSDFLDVYLGAKCSFFISTGSGIDAVPMIFRRLSAFVNLVPLEYGRFWQPGHLFIPKKLRRRTEGRWMTLSEILQSGASRFLFTKQFDEAGIDLVENTADEIAAVAIEMEERLKCTWRAAEEDDALQDRFWSHFQPSELNGVFRARIGAAYLRQNRYLLE